MRWQMQIDLVENLIEIVSIADGEGRWFLTFLGRGFVEEKEEETLPPDEVIFVRVFAFMRTQTTEVLVKITGHHPRLVSIPGLPSHPTVENILALESEPIWIVLRQLANETRWRRVVEFSEEESAIARYDKSKKSMKKGRLLLVREHEHYSQMVRP